jgi:hypothetical protein
VFFGAPRGESLLSCLPRFAASGSIQLRGTLRPPTGANAIALAPCCKALPFRCQAVTQCGPRPSPLASTCPTAPPP